MKKFLIISIIVLLLSAVFFANFKNKQHKQKAMIAGSYAKDFIIGMKNSVIYRLSDFKGEYNIVLAFLDNSPQSHKIKDIIKTDRINSVLQENKDEIIWFNITKDASNHLVIEEKTQKINLSHRTSAENILKLYNFKNFPSIIIINKTGIIQLVYSGYSPTIVNDILDTLKILIQ